MCEADGGLSSTSELCSRHRPQVQVAETQLDDPHLMVLCMLNTLLHCSLREPSIHDGEDDCVLVAGVLGVHRLEDPEVGVKCTDRIRVCWRHGIASSLEAYNALSDALPRHIHSQTWSQTLPSHQLATFLSLIRARAKSGPSHGCVLKTKDLVFL